MADATQPPNDEPPGVDAAQLDMASTDLKARVRADLARMDAERALLLSELRLVIAERERDLAKREVRLLRIALAGLRGRLAVIEAARPPASPDPPTASKSRLH